MVIRNSFVIGQIFILVCNHPLTEKTKKLLKPVKVKAQSDFCHSFLDSNKLFLILRLHYSPWLLLNYMVVERRNIFLLAVAALFILSSCKKEAGGAATDPSNFSLSYGDSILYQKLTAGDYIVSPQNNPPGNYTAFPEGIEINDRT